jgi:hypothetical protein
MQFISSRKVVVPSHFESMSGWDDHVGRSSVFKFNLSKSKHMFIYRKLHKILLEKLVIVLRRKPTNTGLLCLMKGLKI